MGLFGKKKKIPDEREITADVREVAHKIRQELGSAPEADYFKGVPVLYLEKGAIGVFDAEASMSLGFGMDEVSAGELDRCGEAMGIMGYSCFVRRDYLEAVLKAVSGALYKIMFEKDKPVSGWMVVTPKVRVFIAPLIRRGVY